MKKAAIYARFSCSKQREASIEDQLRICREWCAQRGYAVVAEYTDYAKSGRTDDRPGFQEMVANAGESDIVLVYMMDRFSRDVYDAPLYKKRLLESGVRVVSATEMIPDGPESILMESVYEALAAMEVAKTAKRVKRGMEGNALKCMHNGVRVYGYRFGEDGRYEVDEAEAKVVREVFARRIAGEPCNSIAADLARRGVETSHHRPCTHTMVKDMIKNEKYIGVYSWGDVRVEDGMPAIVTKEEFMAAQTAPVKKVRRAEEWRDFPLSKKGVCMGCGASLVGVSGRGHGNVKYSYYRCSKKCGVKPMRADLLEDRIVHEIGKLLSCRETALEVAGVIAGAVRDDGSKERAERARKTAERAEREYANLLRAVSDGLPYDKAKDRMEELSQIADRAREEADLIGAVTALDVDDLADFLQSGMGMEPDQVLKAFVSQVWLSDDDVTVILNYDKDHEPARISFRRGFAENGFGSP